MKSRTKSTIGRTAVNTALLICLASVPGTAQPGAAIVTLQGHVPAVVASAIAQARDQQAANQPITLTVMLNLTDQAGFKAFEASLQDPTSPNYAHPVSGAELTQRFGPSPEAYSSVLGYLQQSGFTLVEGSNNRRTIMVRGTRAQAEAAFQVSIVDYRRGSFSFHAPSRNPSLPATIAPLIAGISGLSNAARPRQAGLSIAPISSSNVGTAYNGAITASGSTNSGGLPPGLTGAGQTVGVIEFSSYPQSDLANTLATEGLSSHINQVKPYPVAGGAPVADCTYTTAGCPATETLLDIAAVLGISPGANVSVFIGPSDSVLQVLNDAIDSVTNGGTSGGILSASLGVCEPNVPPSDAANMDTLLEQYSLTGLTMFVSTGDLGSTCEDGSGNTYANTIPFPADLPHAVAVGGTVLQVNSPGNTYDTETWWSGPTTAGGFGVSTIFTTEPAYQGELYAGAGGRSVPDVAAYAFPGINICQGSGCQTVGGTSLATPLWAGVWALLNQASNESCSSFTSATFNGYLYDFSSTGAFHSAASMGGDFRHVGLGSPNITSLVSQIACGPVSVSSITPSSGSGKGGTTVTVKGSNFIGVSKVKFGSADATHVTIYSDSKLTAESPAATADQVQIEISAPSGRFDATGSNTFSYVPELTAVSPNFGPFYGGTSVKVTGLALSDKYTFKFGGNPATGVKCSSSTTCTMLTPAVDTAIVCNPGPLGVCTFPPPPGLVAVQVIAPVGDSLSVNLFTYQPLTVSEFYPPSGPTTGSGVTGEIWGTSLKAGMTVHFGDVNATVSSCDGSETCVVTLPPSKSAGVVALSVTVDGVTATPTPDQFTYVVYPTITSITPNVIPANPGATAQTVTLTLTGTGFVPGSTSFIFNLVGGAGALSNVNCSSDATQCTATLAVAPRVFSIVTQPVAVSVGGYTSVDSVNLTFPWAPPNPVLGCKGTTCQ